MTGRLQHMWKRLKPAGSRELECKRCERCGLMVRRMWDGKFRYTEIKVGRKPWLTARLFDYRVPDCEEHSVCFTCGSRGTIDTEPKHG